MVRFWAAAAAIFLAATAGATVPTTTSVAEYTCNGTTKTYGVPYRFLDQAHLRVSRVLVASPYTETVLTIATDYTVAGANQASGGTVVLVAPATSCASSSYKLRIRRVTPRTQSTAFSASGAFNPRTHEAAFDRQVMIAQELNDGTLTGNTYDFTGPNANAGTVTAVGSTTARRLDVRLADTINVKDHGAVGDGATMATTAIQGALDAGLNVVFPTAGETYVINDTLTLRAGHRINLNGATIKQTVSQKAIFDATGLSGVTISNGVLQGYRTDYVDSSSSLARGVTGHSASDVTITGCTFRWFAYSAFYGEGVTRFTFTGNTVVGPGLVAAGGILNPTATPTITRNNTGVTVGGTGIVIANNTISETGQGIIVAQGSANVAISNNVIYDVRVEHGMYLDTGIVSLAVTGNTVRNPYQNGIKLQWYDSYGVTPKAIVITGNSVLTTTTGDGIILNSTGGFTRRATDVVISGNTVSGAGQHGINARYVTSGTVSGNTVSGSGDSGIYLDNDTDLTVATNTVSDSQHNGIFDGTNTDLRLLGNVVLRSGLSAGGTYLEAGIFTSAGSGRYIAGNVVKGDSTNMPWALYVSSSVTSTTVTVRDNYLGGALNYGFRLDGGGALAMWSGNVMESATNTRTGYVPTTNQQGTRTEGTFFSSAMPTTGSWVAGEIVWNTAVTNATGQAIGWVRVTTGSGNVLNTDWRAFGATL